MESEPNKGGSTSAHNRESLWFFHNVAKKITEEHGDAFQVRVLEGVIQYVMSLFRVYMSEFNTLWNEARPLTDAEIAFLAPPPRHPSRHPSRNGAR